MISHRKVGGIRFLKVGRLNVSMSISRQRGGGRKPAHTMLALVVASTLTGCGLIAAHTSPLASVWDFGLVDAWNVEFDAGGQTYVIDGPISWEDCSVYVEQGFRCVRD